MFVSLFHRRPRFFWIFVDFFITAHFHDMRIKDIFGVVVGKHVFVMRASCGGHRVTGHVASNIIWQVTKKSSKPKITASLIQFTL